MDETKIDRIARWFLYGSVCGCMLFLFVWFLSENKSLALLALISFILLCFYKFYNYTYYETHAIPGGLTFAEIDAMDGFDFEKFMKEVYEKLGYSVYHTSLSGDQGADLILTSNEGIRIAVQVKRYSGKVSNGAVQEVVAAKGFYKCTKGMVVTNSFFTDSAIQLAQANDVNLVDRNGLIKLLNESFY